MLVFPRLLSNIWISFSEETLQTAASSHQTETRVPPEDDSAVLVSTRGRVCEVSLDKLLTQMNESSSGLLIDFVRR